MALRTWQRLDYCGALSSRGPGCARERDVDGEHPQRVFGFRPASSADASPKATTHSHASGFSGQAQGLMRTPEAPLICPKLPPFARWPCHPISSPSAILLTINPPLSLSPSLSLVSFRKLPLHTRGHPLPPSPCCACLHQRDAASAIWDPLGLHAAIASGA